MINFKIAGQEEQKKVEASLAIDCDGDVNLLINGESIAYISSKDGVLRRLSNEATDLESSGLFFDEDGFIEIDCFRHVKINAEKISSRVEEIQSIVKEFEFVRACRVDELLDELLDEIKNIIFGAKK